MRPGAAVIDWPSPWPVAAGSSSEGGADPAAIGEGVCVMTLSDCTVAEVTAEVEMDLDGPELPDVDGPVEAEATDGDLGGGPLLTLSSSLSTSCDFFPFVLKPLPPSSSCSCFTVRRSNCERLRRTADASPRLLRDGNGGAGAETDVDADWARAAARRLVKDRLAESISNCWVAGPGHGNDRLFWDHSSRISSVGRDNTRLHCSF